MKIPKPIDQAGYERELSKLVAWFEAAIASTELDEPTAHRVNSRYRQLFRAFKDAGRPTSAYAASASAGRLFDTSDPHDVILLHTYRQNLEQSGWIERCGSTVQEYTTGYCRQRRVLIFRALSKHLRTPRLVATFLRKVEALERRRITNSCLTQRMDRGLHHATLDSLPQFNRKQEMIARRLRGENLQSIADDYGITRERVRQIVQDSIFGTNRKGEDGNLV